jgi:hypothetical protein
MSRPSPSEGDEIGPVRKVEAEQVKVAKELLEEGKATDSEIPNELKFLREQAQLQEIRLKESTAKQDLELRESTAKQDLELRETYAKWLLGILAVELVVVNVIFCLYAAKGRDWRLPDGVIQIWLAATVVQVVGIVTVVTRYLFPRRDQNS